MSFFSGFTERTYKKYLYSSTNYKEKAYETSFSEAIGTTSNIIIAIWSLISVFNGYFSNNIKVAVLSIIFLILSIAALVLYYIKKNKITKVYEKNADKTLNIIYFSSSISIALTFIILWKIISNNV